LRGQADADIGHQRRTAGRALLHDVEHLPAAQHGEVGGVPDRVDQPREHRPGQPRQWLLPEIRAADLEGGHPQPVAALLRPVHHETGGGQLRQQVVRRRSRQAEVAGQGGRRHRAGLPGEGLQQASACRAAGTPGSGRTDSVMPPA
jgi:hypothetical protein